MIIMLLTTFYKKYKPINYKFIDLLWQKKNSESFCSTLLINICITNTNLDSKIDKVSIILDYIFSYVDKRILYPSKQFKKITSVSTGSFISPQEH